LGSGASGPQSAARATCSSTPRARLPFPRGLTARPDGSGPGPPSARADAGGFRPLLSAADRATPRTVPRRVEPPAAPLAEPQLLAQVGRPWTPTTVSRTAPHRCPRTSRLPRRPMLCVHLSVYACFCLGRPRGASHRSPPVRRRLLSGAWVRGRAGAACEPSVLTPLPRQPLRPLQQPLLLR
jgi:hypothetical protein